MPKCSDHGCFFEVRYLSFLMKDCATLLQVSLQRIACNIEKGPLEGDKVPLYKKRFNYEGAMEYWRSFEVGVWKVSMHFYFHAQTCLSNRIKGEHICPACSYKENMRTSDVLH